MKAIFDKIKNFFFSKKKEEFKEQVVKTGEAYKTYVGLNVDAVVEVVNEVIDNVTTEDIDTVKALINSEEFKAVIEMAKKKGPEIVKIMEKQDDKISKSKKAMEEAVIGFEKIFSEKEDTEDTEDTKDTE